MAEFDESLEELQASVNLETQSPFGFCSLLKLRGCSGLEFLLCPLWWPFYQEKQRLYEEQLQQVEAALQQDPTEDLRKLKADLQEVITLTQHLLQYKQQPSAEPPTESVAEGASRTADASAEADSRAAPATEKEKEKQSAETEAAPQQPPASVSATASSAAAPSAPLADAAGAAKAQKPQGAASAIVGRTCSAEYEGKKYYAKILEVKRDAKVRLTAATRAGCVESKAKASSLRLRADLQPRGFAQSVYKDVSGRRVVLLKGVVVSDPTRSRLSRSCGCVYSLERELLLSLLAGATARSIRCST